MSGVTRGLQFVALLMLCLSWTAARAEGHVILVYGDSISAAHGIMDENLGWAHLLSLRLKKEHSPFRVVNASASGETTEGGRVRLPKTLQIHQPDIVILELGGNDGLRGYPIDKIEDNLAAMVKASLDAGAKVLLIGMVIPPNYGKRYTDPFAGIYPKVAQRFGVPLLPFLLQGIATRASLLQADGVHPTAKAQPLILDEVWAKLVPILKQFHLESNVATDK